MAFILNFYNTIFLLLLLGSTILVSTLTPKQGYQLSEEEENARCCLQHLDCCKMNETGTKFEVRALLIPCMKKSCNNLTDPHQTVVQSPGYDSSLYDRTNLFHCRKKLMLTIKIKNKGKTNCKNQYIVIDHVYDAVTQKSQRLVHPYVLKIKQEPVCQTYGLQFEHVVNSEPKERVMNKNDIGYTGCSTSETNPTCGSVKYNNEVIPYSTGFCCPCNKEHNEKIDDIKNLTNFSNKYETGVVNEGECSPPLSSATDTLPEYNKNNYGYYEFTGMDGNDHNKPIVVNVEQTVPEENVLVQRFVGVNEPRIRVLRSGRKRRLHKRGGQDCGDTYTPPRANPNTYHDSTHCMEFSDLWYSVYGLRKPSIQHSLTIQIYEKLEDSSGDSYWAEVTKGIPLSVGTATEYAFNEDNTILVHYKTNEPTEEYRFAVQHKTKKLLIPEPLKNVDLAQFPQLAAGPGEYLVVNKDQVQASGTYCSVAGVGYEAFANQPNRCDRPKGSCLENQPKQLWEHDHNLEQQRQTGCYFLKNYAEVPDDPIQGDCENHNKTVNLFYTGSYVSVLDLEMKADYNFILRPNSLATITEVYSDSTSMRKTIITVKVTNSGLVSSVFFVGLSGFPMDVPASFNTIASKPALLAPQHQHIYTLEIECELTTNSFTGDVQVLNMNKEIVAIRRLRIEKGDRCICIWHCNCACFVTDKGLKCKPMGLQQYHAAGFQGGLPISLQVVKYTLLDDMISIMLYIFLFLFLTLLLLGVFKAIAGFYIVPIGLWGLDIMLGLPKKLHRYFEQDISHRTVVYDENGWPVHPDTKEKVRNTTLVTELCINIVFFIIYPFALLFIIMKKLFWASYRIENVEECTCKIHRHDSPINNFTQRQSSEQFNE